MSNKKSKTFTQTAVENPIFQEAAKNAAKAAAKDAYRREVDEEDDDVTRRVEVDGSVLDVDAEELAQIKKWAMYMKYTMIVLSTLMIILALYNFISLTNLFTSLSTMFLAAYLMVFACMICCFECALKSVAYFIVQNFGFMYNAYGRGIFLFFVALLCWELSTFGKVMFALILAYGCVYIYLSFKHPQYGKYLRTLHYFNRAKAKQAVAEERKSTKNNRGFAPLNDEEV